MPSKVFRGASGGGAGTPTDIAAASVSFKPGFENNVLNSTTITCVASSAAPARVLINGAIYTNTSDAVVGLTVAGRSGLDTGSVAAATVYYVYAIPAASGATFNLVASITAPTGAGPTGFTSAWSYLGCVSTLAGSADLPEFTHYNGLFASGSTLESETSTTSASDQTHTFVSPAKPIMKYWRVRCFFRGTVADQYGQVKTIAGGGDSIQVRASVTTVLNFFGPSLLPCNTSNTLYSFFNAGHSFQILLVGWQENPMEYP